MISTRFRDGYVPVGIAMGSNLGDRVEELKCARSFVESLTAVGWREAQWYESEPVGCPPGSRPFLNTAMEIGVADAVTPREIFEKLKAYELERGRPALHAINSPRLIDLDIIYFGDVVLDTPELVIPHPRATQRRFVLEPLCDIDPDLVLPGQTKTVAELCAGLKDQVVCGWGYVSP